MKFPFLVLLILICSCSSLSPSGSPEQGITNYSFTDISGTYKLSREARIINKRLVNRNIFISSDSSQKVVEKNIAVSQIGTIKVKGKRLLTVRPMASDFSVWLEGKKYSSSMRLNQANKSMTVKLESPEQKWKGSRDVPFPKGKYFCFYSQLAECLYHNHFLERTFKTPRQRLDFFLIWDSWPYLQDQLTNVGKNLFAPASVKYEGTVKNNLYYTVEVEGQIMLYHFSKSFDLVKIAWIAQGITIVPPGEEIQHEDQ